MSPKQLLLFGGILLLIVNGSIFGTLYIIDLISGPTDEEVAAAKEAELQAAKDALYAKLPPVEEFKSKASHIKSIGEAISICESKLNSTVTTGKSWSVNSIESRFIAADDLYKIFMEYQTVARQNEPEKSYKVVCEVSAETREIPLWKATPI